MSTSLDEFFPRENGVSALDVMAQSRKGEFRDNAHYLEAKKQGLLPREFVVRNAVIPKAENRYRNLRYR